MEEFSEGGRLPVYLLLDTSGSMDGEPIEAVREGVKYLVADLKTEADALDKVWLSIITFDSKAEQVVPLADISQMQTPVLKNPGGQTALGGALKLLMECMKREVRKTDKKKEQKGDFKPLVFLMTDGKPTDKWEPYADELIKAKPANIVACAAGPEADVRPLKSITENVVRLQDMEPEKFREFFKWVSASITSQSVKCDQGGGEGGIIIQGVPQGIEIVQ